VSGPRQRRLKGLTLAEVVIAVALLSVVIVGFGSMSTLSLRASREAGPHFIAQEAAVRVVERMRSSALDTAYQAWWVNATKVSLGGVEWAVGGTSEYDDPDEGVLAGLDDVISRGVMGLPSDTPRVLRVRFLSEAEYQAVWGLANPEDLNFDGTIDAAATSPGADYRMYPVLVELRWSDQGTEKSYQLKAVLVNQPVLDPRR